MTTDLALPLVYFSGGPNRRNYGRADGVTPAVHYLVPQDTLDPRYATCTDHHVGCDCREAVLHEEINEYRVTIEAVQAAIDTILDGHVTGYGDGPGRCRCTGCQIVRAAHMTNHRGA